jgi:hypothetical protein
MNAMSNFQTQVAQWRQQRRQQETAEYAQQIRNDYVATEKSRNEALNRGDRETAAMLDDDLMRIEGEYQEFLASQPVQTDPRQVEFMRRISPFIEKYGQRGVAALDLAHQYATRPRNPNTNNPANTGMGLRPNTPAYFRAMRNLLEMYGKDYGMRYDRSEDLLSADQAAKISGLSPEQYNYAVRQMAAQGRLGTDKK